MRTEMTPEEKGKIIAFMETLNYTQIARKIGRDLATVRRFIAKYERTGNIENLPRSGRPPVLNNDEKDSLVNETLKKRRAPLHEIVNGLGLNCGLTTAKKTLYKAGIYSHIAAKKPFVSERHAAARVNWCANFKEKTAYYWEQVVFSDESSVEIGKQSRQIKVWRNTGERFNTECLAPTFKSGRQSVMVWACFAGGVKGPLIFCDENKERNARINSNTYINIMKKYLLPFYHAVHDITGGRVVFQQDNAPIHTSGMTTEWLNANKIVTMDWPANSPDLNPIENIWKLLKDNIQNCENFPRTINDLKAALLEEWENLDSSIFKEAALSMPRRIDAVLKAGGGPTKY